MLGWNNGDCFLYWFWNLHTSSYTDQIINQYWFKSYRVTYFSVVENDLHWAFLICDYWLDCFVILFRFLFIVYFYIKKILPNFVYQEKIAQRERIMFILSSFLVLRWWLLRFRVKTKNIWTWEYDKRYYFTNWSWLTFSKCCKWVATQQMNSQAISWCLSKSLLPLLRIQLLQANLAMYIYCSTPPSNITAVTLGLIFA